MCIKAAKTDQKCEGEFSHYPDTANNDSHAIKLEFYFKSPLVHGQSFVSSLETGTIGTH